MCAVSMEKSQRSLTVLALSKDSFVWWSLGEIKTRPRELKTRPVPWLQRASATRTERPRSSASGTRASASASTASAATSATGARGARRDSFRSASLVGSASTTGTVSSRSSRVSDAQAHWGRHETESSPFSVRFGFHDNNCAFLPSPV